MMMDDEPRLPALNQHLPLNDQLPHEGGARGDHARTRKAKQTLSVSLVHAGTCRYMSLPTIYPGSTEEGRSQYEACGRVSDAPRGEAGEAAVMQSCGSTGGVPSGILRSASVPFLCLPPHASPHTIHPPAVQISSPIFLASLDGS